MKGPLAALAGPAPLCSLPSSKRLGAGVGATQDGGRCQGRAPQPRASLDSPVLRTVRVACLLRLAPHLLCYHLCPEVSCGVCSFRTHDRGTALEPRADHAGLWPSSRALPLLCFTHPVHKSRGHHGWCGGHVLEHRGPQPPWTVHSREALGILRSLRLPRQSRWLGAAEGQGLRCDQVCPDGWSSWGKLFFFLLI